VRFLEVSSLNVQYVSRAGVTHALEDVDLALGRGCSLAVVGESGCGKSTLAYAILKLLPSNATVTGSVTYDGADILGMSEESFRTEFRWRRIALVPQGAFNALTPVHRIRHQIVETILAHEQADKKEAEARAGTLLKMVGIEAPRHEAYPHEFSGGMRQRAVIAAALACNPELLVADEPTTALDVIVQAQVLALLKDLYKRLGLSLILITHDLSIVSEICDEIMILYAGRVVEYADSREFFKRPRHPYSRRLLESIPLLEENRKSRRTRSRR